MFLDLICPFSRKMWVAVCDLLKTSPSIGNEVCFIMHQVPQPWHAQGSYVHEAALAVKEVAPDLYPNYIGAIYECFDKGKFTDRDTWEKSRTQINAELCDLAASVGVAVSAADGLGERRLAPPGHGERTARLAGRLADKLQLLPEDQQDLETACRLVDLGKASVRASPALELPTGAPQPSS